MQLLNLSDNVKIGILLVTLGGCFLALGVLLFFDAGLRTIGEAQRAARATRHAPCRVARPPRRHRSCPSPRPLCDRAGNALLLAGFPCLIGWGKTLDFFNPVKRRDRVRGIVCFFGGIALVFLLRWCVALAAAAPRARARAELLCRRPCRCVPAARSAV